VHDFSLMDALQNQALDIHEAGSSSVSPSLAEDRREIELRERKLATVTDRVLSMARMAGLRVVSSIHDGWTIAIEDAYNHHRLLWWIRVCPRTTGGAVKMGNGTSSSSC
jgi:hypothetical protein